MLCVGARAQAGELGAGVVLGSPIGGTVKYFMTDTHAVDGGVGAIGGDPAVYADYLWHGWNAFPQPKDARLGAYLGLGGRLRGRSDDASLFGIRTMAGANLRLRSHPVELFAELGPVFEVAPSSFIQMDGGVGVRYYFQSGSKKEN